MIRTEILNEDLVRTYSDIGWLLHCLDDPEDVLYGEAVDLISLNRVYEEIEPIPEEDDDDEGGDEGDDGSGGGDDGGYDGDDLDPSEATEEDMEYARAGRIMMGVEE